MRHSFDYSTGQAVSIYVVILGHDGIDHVINSPELRHSTTIGRYGSHVCKGKFRFVRRSMSSQSTTALRSFGGPTAFPRPRVWDAIRLMSTVQFNSRFCRRQEGFPGNLNEMAYRLENEVNALTSDTAPHTDKSGLRKPH